MEYYIGIDGGGTKSRLLAMDKQQNKIGEAYGDSTNLASNSREFVFTSLEHLFQDFFRQTNVSIDECRGICIGSAGLDLDSTIVMMTEIISEIGFNCKITAINDSLLVLAATTKGAPGVVVVSGTGSIAYGLDSKGNTIRCGGWGHILDDAGSGYWIGEKAISCALRSFDGRGEKTALEDVVKEKLGLTYMPECIDFVYNRFSKAEIAAYTRIVKELAENDDQVCIQILEQAAYELFLLVDAVLDKMTMDHPKVIVSGGTILNIDLLYERFIAYMKKHYPEAEVMKIDKAPVFGAVYLAMKDS